jgi:Skp family chaperone for outer membrane proteins
MKKPIRSLTLLAAALAFGVSASAQAAIKIATVDVVSAYESYWETKANEDKLRETFEKADEQAKKMRAEGAAMVDEFNVVQETSENSMLTQEARDEAAARLQGMANQIQTKQQELQQFVANTQRRLELTRSNHQSIMFDKVKTVANEIALAQGATLVLDTSGPTAIGFSGVLYADPSFDITELVKAELEKTKPVEEEPETATEEAPEATTVPAE